MQTRKHTRLQALLMALLLFPLLGFAAQTQPNLLLILAEDMSPRLGAWGDTVARTPRLDALAATGVRFDHVFTTAGVCAPSRAAMISGQHQISIAAQHMRTTTGPLGPYLARPPAALRAFPELLRAAGYYTFTDAKLDYQFSGIRAGSGPFTIWDRDGADDTAWRQRRNGQPFFGLINLIETHESGVMRPFGPPHSDTHRATQQWRAGLASQHTEPRTDPASVMLPPYYPDIPEVRADIARHYDNIALMDRRVGRILDALQADGLMESTIVLWSTDHGDGLPRAKRELLDTGLRVPMILHVPRPWRHLAPGYAEGSTDSRLISFVDLAPTFLRWANAPEPPWLHGQAIYGEPKRTYVYAARDRIDEVQDRQRAVRDARYKYIYSHHPDVPGGHALAYRDNLDMVRAWRSLYESGQLNPAQARWFEAPGPEQLYDTYTDPHEIRNLVTDPTYTATLKRLRAALHAFGERVPDTGRLREQELRDTLLVEGEIPQTAPPVVTQRGGEILMSHPHHASTGFQVNDGPWLLYTAPVAVAAGNRITARSVRYGWRESPPVTFIAK